MKNQKNLQRLDGSVKKLEGRLTKYEAGTPPALALQKQIEKTKRDLIRYGKAGLLCGTDGLPHLITDGRWSHQWRICHPWTILSYT